MTLRQLSDFSARVEALSKEYGGLKVKESKTDLERVASLVRIIKNLPLPSAIALLTGATKTK